MAKVYVDFERCKSFETAIRKITQMNIQFHNGDSISLNVKRVGDRFEFDSAAVALIFDELLIESFYQSKKE